MYRTIHSLGLIKLKNLKIYIKIYYKTRFIELFKFFVNAHIVYNKKLDRSIQLYVNYQEFYNLTVKNWYLLPFIDKFFYQIVYVKQFTQLNLTNVYHWMRIQEGKN